ncbi:hypothetical protein [Kordiimonas laminariae]|uniref:hypothetical protein n=1 Tax=Kordiimonas laminariae TaxID=2917717 RepID=UPI001FF43930|nr:hypothetical protein [Kordiimonas laminariae]MCK0068331.1 hypothetical protein [Kordiimonas laminariae]
MDFLSKVKQIFKKTSLDDDLRSQIENILSGQAKLPAFRALHHTMREIEKRDVLASFFRPPFYHWKSLLGKEEREQLAVRCRVLSNHTDALTSLDHIRIYGLLLRLQGPVEAEVQAFNEVIESLDSIETLDDELLNELLIILVAESKFPRVRQYVLKALERTTINSQLRELYCDLYFQSIYNSIASHVFKDTFDDTHRKLLSDALELCEMYLGATSPHLNHYRAIIECTEKRHEESVRWLCRPDSKEGYFSQFFRAGFNVKTPEDMRAFAEAPVGETEHLKINMRHTGARDCTLVSCNKVYYSMYFKNFAESFAIKNPKGTLHLHAINFEVDEDALQTIEDEFGIYINFTEDSTDLDVLNPDIMKGYCAGARYMYVPQYLDIYDEILITDIDGVLKLSHQDVWSGREGRILLSTLILDPARAANFVFWSNIGAGATGIPATKEGRLFAKIFSHYLFTRFVECQKRGERFFFSDQVGLLLSLMFMNFDSEVFMKMPQLFAQPAADRVVNRGRAKKDAQSKLLEGMREAE